MMTGGRVGTGNAMDKVMWGSNLSDTFLGLDGNDRLMGYDRPDVIYGGTGNDSVFGGDSTDRVYCDKGSDSVWGDRGSDTLDGGDGDDSIDGGSGSDTLMGGNGRDVFVFTDLQAADLIADFGHGVDRIALQSHVFSGLATVGRGTGAQFWTAAGATSGHDESDRLILDATTGDLYYDVDGNGAAAAIRFAQVAVGVTLSASDFVMS